MLPGHKERMLDLFKIIEQLNPKNSLKHTLSNAVKHSNKVGKVISITDQKEARTTALSLGSAYGNSSVQLKRMNSSVNK